MPGELSACNANPVMGSLKAYLEEENGSFKQGCSSHTYIYMCIYLYKASSSSFLTPVAVKIACSNADWPREHGRLSSSHLV